MALGLGSTILLTRVLNPGDLSNYLIILSALGFVVLAAHSGAGQVAMSVVSQAVARDDRAEAMTAASNAAAVVTLGGVVFSGIGVFVLFLALRDTDALSYLVVILFFIAGVLFSLAMLWVDFLRAQQRLYEASWLGAQPQSGGPLPGVILLGVVTTVSAAGATLSLVQVLLVLLGGWCLMASTLWVLVRNPADLRPRLSALSLTRMRQFAALSWPVASSGLALYAVTQADLWFVHRLRPAEEAVAYGLAGTFVKYVSAANVLLGALLPGLVGQYWARGDLEGLASVLVKLARLATGVSLSLLLVITVVGELLLHLTVGAEYAQAWLPLVILSMGHLVNSALGYSHVLLVTAGRTKAILWASLLAGGGTLLGLHLITPGWGAVGAAIVSSCGLGVYGLVTCVAAARVTGIWSHVAGGYRSSLR